MLLGMLLPREELKFDFKGQAFDLNQPEERRLLAWVFNQFLYGEVTGIQCGHWLYRSPHLKAAAFLAKQAGEEISHVRRILRILSILGKSPRAPHPTIRFLATGMMGGSWGEHVALEMALGEGLVLAIFYAMADTIGDLEIKKILETAVLDEEGHVEFGERETRVWLERYPGDRHIFAAAALLQIMVLRWLRSFVLRRIVGERNASHPVLGRFGNFYDHVVDTFEKRVLLLGITEKPITRLPMWKKIWLLLGYLPRKSIARLFRARKLLTAVYLDDPVVLAESRRDR